MTITLSINTSLTKEEVESILYYAEDGIAVAILESYDDSQGRGILGRLDIPDKFISVQADNNNNNNSNN